MAIVPPLNFLGNNAVIVFLISRGGFHMYVKKICSKLSFVKIILAYSNGDELVI